MARLYTNMLGEVLALSLTFLEVTTKAKANMSEACLLANTIMSRY
jgi:hypothetical protein